MKRIKIRPEHCVGCKLCEVVCKAGTVDPEELIKTYKEGATRPTPRCVVEGEGADTFAVQCRHCEDAPCIEACMTGAMHRAPDGTVQHDPERCIGCWMCVMVCPYGAIMKVVDEKKVVAKCDLCSARETPCCVLICPNEALVVEESQEQPAKRR